MTAVQELRTAVVCSTRAWVAKDLEHPDWTIEHNHGLWLPERAPGEADAWWMPVEHLAWMNVSGYGVRLAAPGPHWLTTFAPEHLGRRVTACRVYELTADTFPAWVKLAEVKTDHVPSAWWNSHVEFETAARAAGVSPLSWVQVSDRVPRVNGEYRFFIAHNQVTAGAPYRLGDTWWDEGLGTVNVPDRVARFAGRVVQAAVDGPPAYTLDVATTSDGQLFVIEVNPVFSSATYDADPGGVLEALAAAVDPDPQWLYVPDPFVAQRVTRKRPLTR